MDLLLVALPPEGVYSDLKARARLIVRSSAPKKRAPIMGPLCRLYIAYLREPLERLPPEGRPVVLG